MNFPDSSFFLNIFLDAQFGGVMILPNSTASSLFRPRCSTCLQEVQRGFLCAVISRLALRCVPRLNKRDPLRRAVNQTWHLFFLFGGSGFVFVFVDILACAAATSDGKDAENRNH
jgi:hypothetical protein